MMEQLSPEEIEIQDKQFEELLPQVKIYNRNVYLRNAKEQAKQQEVAKQIHELSQKPKLTPNSYAILVQKLQQQLQQIYQRRLEDSDQISFQHFQQIFNQMGRFEEVTKQQDQIELQLLVTQLWLLLINYDLEVPAVTRNILTSLIHILFCPYTLKQPQIIGLFQHAFPNIQEMRSIYIEKYPQGSEQVLDTSGLVRLWLKIKRKFITFSNTGNTDKKHSIQDANPLFQPQINPKSRVYAQRSLQKYLRNNRLDNVKQSKLNELSGYISGGKQLSYHQILYKRGLQKQQILKTLREKQIPIKVDGKTLTQEQTKKLVENLYIIKQKRQDIDYQKIKQEEELKLCTFQPNTIQYHKRNTAPTVRNYQKQIQRLEKGRKEKFKKKQAYQNLGRVKQRTTGPPSFVERQKPKLILEIKVGDKIVRLRLKGDEEPRIAAKKFVIKHNLQQSMQDVLQSIIEQQLAALQQ